MFDGAESPLTQTFGLGIFEPISDRILSKTEEFFLTRGAPVQHEISPLAGVALGRHLAKRGYAPLEMSTVMFLHPSEHESAPASALTARVADQNDSEAFAIAAGSGWSSAGDFAQTVTNLSRVMFATRGYIAFLVEERGQVIATGGLAVHAGVALFAGASTIPEARGRGAQKALLDARLKYAREAGCDLAMMVTEPGSGSQRNGERSRFRIAYTRTKWQLEVSGRP